MFPILFGKSSRRRFSPATMSGLLTWFDSTNNLYQERTGASATTPATTDGNPIGTLTMRAGGYAIATSDANRPTKQTLNGLPVARFDGAGDSMTFTGVTHTAFTFLTVSKRVASNSYLLAGPAGSASWRNTGTNEVFERYLQAALAYANNYANNTLNFTGFRYDGANGQWYSNGAFEVSQAVVSGVTQPTNIINNGSLVADIGELFIFDRSLSDTEIASMYSYVKNKWGI